MHMNLCQRSEVMLSSIGNMTYYKVFQHKIFGSKFDLFS